MSYIHSKAEELAQLGDDLFTPRFWTRVLIPFAAVSVIGVSLPVVANYAATGKHPYLVGTTFTVRSAQESPLEKK